MFVDFLYGKTSSPVYTGKWHFMFLMRNHITNRQFCTFNTFNTAVKLVYILLKFLNKYEFLLLALPT